LADTNQMMDFKAGDEVGSSRWITIDQAMISDFGRITLDPDPMHVDADWAAENSPFEGTIAFGFLTVSLLTHMMYSAMKRTPYVDGTVNGHYLNYGFDRLRFVAPVKVGSRVRGHFRMTDRVLDDAGRWRANFHCSVEIEGEDRPALVADWLSVWVPPGAD
jgi:acyl dehydratase